MPHATVPLPDVYETIMRSVAVDAVKQIATMMALPESTQVYLPGRSETVPMNDGMFGNCCDTANAVHFDAQERVTVTYEEIAEENFALSTAVRNNENFPLFADQTRGIVMRPVRRYVDFRLDIEYRAPNVVLAQRWLDDQRMRFSAGGVEMTMALTYHYNVPPSLLGLMKGLYDTMQKSCWPSDLSFQQWMELYWCQPQTEMATLIDTHPTLSIYERQVDCVGWFDFGNTPETPQRVDAREGGGAYEVRFSYICRYERPTHIFIEYPMVVHQCPIPQVFRPKYIYQNYQSVDRKTTALRGSLDHAFILMREGQIPYIQHPDTDTWHTDEIPPKRFTFFTGLLCLGADLTTLVDLSKLGRFSFTGHFLEMFATWGDKAFADGSFFEFRLYENDQRLRIPLTMEQGTLIVKSSMALNPQKCYHLQISVVKNFYGINDRYWEGIRRYPTCCWTLCRLFRVGPGKRPLAKIELLGLGADRLPDADYPGEGTTAYVDGIPHFPRGIVKWGDIEEARKDQDRNDGGGGGDGEFINQDRFGPTNTLFAHIITERRPCKE